MSIYIPGEQIDKSITEYKPEPECKYVSEP